jgi:hypothetical protein
MTDPVSTPSFATQVDCEAHARRRDANSGSTTYVLQGPTVRSIRSAGESSRSAAADRLLAAHSHTGSVFSRDVSWFSRRASISA